MSLDLKTKLPIACNLNALNNAEQQRRAELSARLQKSVHAVVPIPDGYIFRLPSNGRALLEVAEFISFERRCCPFLSFQINLNESDEAITVQLSGPDGVKEFLAAEFGL